MLRPLREQILPPGWRWLIRYDGRTVGGPFLFRREAEAFRRTFAIFRHVSRAAVSVNMDMIGGP